MCNEFQKEFLMTSQSVHSIEEKEESFTCIVVTITLKAHENR